MINGNSRKDVSGRKEQFQLTFKRLSQATLAQILSEYELKTTLLFVVTDGDLNIASTEVHVDVSQRDYNTKGSEFREDFTLVLTEVE